MSENQRGLDALKLVCSRLRDGVYLEAIHEGAYAWTASFTFQEAARPDVLEQVLSQLHLPLPLAYQEFLRYANGARLYYDNESGQWGFDLYGTDTIVTRNAFWKKRYADEWPATYLVFAESRGDSDILVFDTVRMAKDQTDCGVLDGVSSSIVAPQNWKLAARSFGHWLDQLIVAQGAKYWRWSR